MPPGSKWTPFVFQPGATMAKRKQKSDSGSPKRRRRSAPEDLSELPDPRVMESAMRELVGDLAPGPENKPLAEANEILRQAYQERDESRRIRLANKALQICPDCADAFVLLAEHAPSRKE